MKVIRVYIVFVLAFCAAISNAVIAQTDSKVGDVQICYKPFGADVMLDGTACNSSVGVLFDVPEGEHAVVVSADGYDTLHSTIFVKGGEVTKFVGSLQKVQPAETAIREEIGGHEAIDLGLPSGVKWATVDVSGGFTFKNYYGWGETMSGLAYSAEAIDSYSKDYKDISADEKYDAATAQWGLAWRMPTKSEIEEIIKVCQWVPIEDGYKVVGPNGNSIVLFSGGYMNGWPKVQDEGNIGLYWSSTPCDADNTSSYVLCLQKNGFGVGPLARFVGCRIRAVTD